MTDAKQLTLQRINDAATVEEKYNILLDYVAEYGRDEDLERAVEEARRHKKYTHRPVENPDSDRKPIGGYDDSGDWYEQVVKPYIEGCDDTCFYGKEDCDEDELPFA